MNVEYVIITMIESVPNKKIYKLLWRLKEMSYDQNIDYDFSTLKPKF